MDNKLFSELLNRANLTKKEFSIKANLAYSTVTNWNTANKTPDWVESWLENYIKAKVADDIVKAIEPILKSK